MRLIDADKLYPDCMTKDGKLAISQSQIANALTVSERKQGEWVIVKDEKWGDNVKCPFCGKELAGTDLNFCCNCGAKMI